MNCSAPSEATAAVQTAARTGHAVVIYPNSGEGWDAAARQWVAAGDGEADAAHWPVEGWVDDGARLVGGCCRITPSDISTMGEQLVRTP